MTFDEIYNAVIADTARPDMGKLTAGGDGRIPNRIKAATLSLHSMDFFYKDIKSAIIAFDATAFIQELDTRVLPLYRSLSYIRKWDPTLAAYQANPLLNPPLYDSNGYLVSPNTLAMLAVLTNPQDIFDSYHSERTDVCYQVGGSIMIKSSSSIKQALVGWYAYPNLSWETNLFDSWIAAEFGQAVVDTTVSWVFSVIGKQEQSRKYDDPRTGLVPYWRNEIKMGNIQPQGS